MEFRSVLTKLMLLFKAAMLPPCTFSRVRLVSLAKMVPFTNESEMTVVPDVNQFDPAKTSADRLAIPVTLTPLNASPELC